MHMLGVRFLESNGKAEEPIRGGGGSTGQRVCVCVCLSLSIYSHVAVRPVWCLHCWLLDTKTTLLFFWGGK